METELIELKKHNETLQVERDDLRKVCMEQGEIIEKKDMQKLESQLETVIEERDELKEALTVSNGGKLLKMSHLSGNMTISNNDDNAEDELINAFQVMDKNHDGVVNVREIIIALRQDEALANLLHLPSHIRQEDGSRDKLEEIFQQMDQKKDRLCFIEQFWAQWRGGLVF